MKTHKLPLTIIIIGIAGTIMSAIRWTFTYHDVSNALFGIVIGLTFTFMGYVYNYLKDTDSKIDFIKKQIDAIGSVVTKTEKEAIEDEARGIDEDY
jgi:hypothetical protein